MIVNSSIPFSLRTALITFVSDSHGPSFDTESKSSSFSSSFSLLESAFPVSASQKKKSKRNLLYDRSRIPYNVFLKSRMNEERKKNPSNLQIAL